MGKKGKSKVFVESKDVAVDLAKSVADIEEQKSRAKVEAHHSKASAHASSSSEQKQKSSSKTRLERAKAAVAAQAARAKREKAKLRKKVRTPTAGDEDAPKSQTTSGEKHQSNSGGVTKTKKRVTFG
ncbi:hypothetical protein GY45DRAFT_1368594 [Cubamyces sp. BRFM 1775]|nr:hypothetical protein GY45DRAFT_1368594 [Cubamyces sp. BRFM 1775]